ncbi:MAG: glycogen synthase GlgA [Campylobacterales bacterium]|nr:glycogen synthase GlgA [Campylobacterales bacterium]
MPKYNILLTASEVAPFAKTGGLADVAGALPKALKTLGHDVRVVMPRYYIIDKEKYGLQKLEGALSVHMGIMGEKFCAVYEGTIPNSSVPIYFIEYEEYFGRRGLYNSEDGSGYRDNDNRFIFFSKATMQLAKKLHFHPDVIHANDWHTAAVPLLLNTHYAFDPLFSNTGSLLSIHNLEHQGKFYKGAMDVLGVGWEHFKANELEEYDGINLLKGGIVHADAINAVSQKYAQEIRTSEFGFGLEQLINHHEYKLHGILNGVDYDEWSPEIDTLIESNFSAESLEGKAICKQALQKSFGLEQREDVALIGLVGRLAEQKGIGLIAGAIDTLLAIDIQIILLGTGEKWAESFFREKAEANAHKFACYIGYDNTLAHQIEAGSDMFLMPSLFEPCGLNQIYSLRYGTLPIVRATGGLDDTIENYDTYSKSGTGFKFYEASADALTNTVAWAVNVFYNDKEGFYALIQNAMAKRYEWSGAAKAYEELYSSIIEGRKN